MVENYKSKLDENFGIEVCLKILKHDPVEKVKSRSD